MLLLQQLGTSQKLSLVQRALDPMELVTITFKRFKGGASRKGIEYVLEGTAALEGGEMVMGDFKK